MNECQTLSFSSIRVSARLGKMGQILSLLNFPFSQLIKSYLINLLLTKTHKAEYIILPKMGVPNFYTWPINLCLNINHKLMAQLLK